MIAVICFTVCVGAVLSALLFQGSWIFCIAAAVVSLAMLVVQCFLFKNSRLKGILMPILTAALLIGCMFIPSRAADYGYFDHMKQLESLTSYLENEKSDKAAEKRTEIEEKYGEDDSLRYALAVDAIFKGNISDAETIVDSFSSRESAVYYLLWEEIIAAKYASNEELVKNLEPLYIEAADKYPEWEYMNKNAGCFLFDEREYAKACYYLTNAYVYADEPDGEVMYYLGASLIEQGFTEKGFSLLNEAYKTGVEDNIKGHIAWYVQQYSKTDAPEKDMPTIKTVETASKESDDNA